MKITLFIIIVVIIYQTLRNLINLKNVQHLKSQGCNAALYNLIRQAKDTCTGSETIRVETSIKITPDGQRINNRYVIPVLLTEWDKYNGKQQHKILSLLGFSTNDIKIIRNNHRELINNGTDIIFGQEGNKGKIYLDFNNDNRTHLVCYERGQPVNTPTKTYTEENQSDVLIVKDHRGGKLGTHTRLESPVKNIYWKSQLESGTSYYSRPDLWVLILSEIIDAAKLPARIVF